MNQDPFNENEQKLDKAGFGVSLTDKIDMRELARMRA
jgi:hypothetical protein